MVLSLLYTFTNGRFHARYGNAAGEHGAASTIAVRITLTYRLNTLTLNTVLLFVSRYVARIFH